jgi:hypothetical protein
MNFFTWGNFVQTGVLGIGVLILVITVLYKPALLKQSSRHRWILYVVGTVVLLSMAIGALSHIDPLTKVKLSGGGEIINAPGGVAAGRDISGNSITIGRCTADTSNVFNVPLGCRLDVK